MRVARPPPEFGCAMARLFAALALPETVRTELAALAVPLAGVRWLPPANLHLTLRFIGAATAEQQEAFEKTLERVQVEPFILPVRGVGIFPTRGPARVLWAGLHHAHPRLFQLRQQVDEALLAVDPALDVSSFHPHITVARLDKNHGPGQLAKFLQRNAAFEAPPFRVSEFHLMASEPQPGEAPLYHLVRTFPLQPK